MTEELTLFSSQQQRRMPFSIVPQGCPLPLLIPELCRTNGLSDYCNRAPISLYRSLSIGLSEVCRTIQLCTLRTEEKASILFLVQTVPREQLLGGGECHANCALHFH